MVDQVGVHALGVLRHRPEARDDLRRVRRQINETNGHAEILCRRCDRLGQAWRDRKPAIPSVHKGFDGLVVKIAPARRKRNDVAGMWPELQLVAVSHSRTGGLLMPSLLPTGQRQTSVWKPSRPTKPVISCPGCSGGPSAGSHEGPDA